MALSMYQVTIPVFIRMLNNLSAILQKASHYAEVKKIDPAVLINARLAPDMYALARQIQIATDVVKGCAARLAQQEVPSYADSETTFLELEERIAKTIHFLQSINQDKFVGCDERQICLSIRDKELHFSGCDYVCHFVMPNFYFHLSTAYGILRHNGVELGKMDFLGGR